MTIIAATATERLRAYQSRHRIEVDKSAEWDRCDTDGIRVHLNLNRTWRHDQSELARLQSEAAREDLDRGVVHFPSPDEIARAAEIAAEGEAIYRDLQRENDYFRTHQDDDGSYVCHETGHADSCTCVLGSDPILVVGGNGVYGVEIEWAD